MPGIPATGSVDRRLIQAAEDAKVLPKGASPHGKTAADTKEAQKPHLLGKVGMTGGLVAAEALHHGLEHASGVSAGVAAALLGPGLTALKLLYSWDKAHREGEALRDAYARDSVNLAVVYAAASALPPAYVAKMRVDLKPVDGERGGAMKILNRVMVNDAEWQTIKRQAEEHVRIGCDTATRLNVTSKEGLELRLKNDRQFAVLYQQDIAFKHGVDSVVYDNVQRQLYGK